MDTMYEDKAYLFDKLGMNKTVELTHQNASGEGHSSYKDIAKT
jgi:hypothetical protein